MSQCLVHHSADCSAQLRFQGVQPWPWWTLTVYLVHPDLLPMELRSFNHGCMLQSLTHMLPVEVIRLINEAEVGRTYSRRYCLATTSSMCVHRLICSVAKWVAWSVFNDSHLPHESLVWPWLNRGLLLSLNSPGMQGLNFHSYHCWVLNKISLILLAHPHVNDFK